jgi:predicted GNAT family N-acyltransferase
MSSIRVDRVSFDPESIATSSHYAHCLEIRRIVFTFGQGVPGDLEIDGLDEDADHFLASKIDLREATPVGVARMRRLDQHAKAERVGVLASKRDHGVGRALMHAIEMRARDLELEAVVLHAQVEVISFYEKLGYEAYGEIFEEAGIEHRGMRKFLR